MDCTKGAEKRPLESAGDADSERSSECNEDDCDPFDKSSRSDPFAQFQHPTNFPPCFLDEEELVPQIARAGFLEDANLESSYPEETPCLKKRLAKKTKSA